MKQSKIADKDTYLPEALNAFYAWFEQNASGVVSLAMTPLPSVTAADVRLVFVGVNPRKATGPDRVPGRALRSCVDQLAEVFTDIFNLSLLQAKAPTCFKKTIIISVPKKPHATCINDYHPAALTSIIMKCFGKLFVAHISSSLPACLKLMEFAYQYIRSTADAISLGLHSSLEHLDNKDTDVRLLLIDLQLRLQHHCSFQTDLKTLRHRKKGGIRAPIYINGVEVESIDRGKFLGVMITDNLSRTSQCRCNGQEGKQCRFFLRWLTKFSISTRTLTNFYRGTVESILRFHQMYERAIDSKRQDGIHCD
eukprot:g43407.t1